MQNESISSPACKKILSKSLEALAKRDSLKNVSFDNHLCYLHEDHRWVLPLIFEAQSLNLIPRPVTMVGFDWHRDGGDVRPSFRKKLAPKSKISFEDVVELCEEDLAKDDGDWIKAHYASSFSLFFQLAGSQSALFCAIPDLGYSR